MLPRLKFKIAPLVNEILDHVPPVMFKSSTTIFIDPAMAGGQFVVEVIRRLRDNGHSDDNIASRVYGLAEDQIDLNYAVRTNKLIGKYSVGGIDAMEELIKMGMKFDVVLGNPPYQSGDSDIRAAKKTGTKPLWFSFSELAVSLTKPEGITALVTPSSWIQNISNIHNTITANEMVACKVFNKSPFGNAVGTTVSYWVIKKHHLQHDLLLCPPMQQMI